MMDITLKSIKIYAGLSEETIAFQASLYVDGKRVGEAKNAGHGGANDVRVFKDGRWDRALIDTMEAEAATHTWEYEGEAHPHSLDSYIGELVNNIQEQRDVKRKCRTQTLFRIPDETYHRGEYHVMKRKYDSTVKAYLIKTYGEQVAVKNELLFSTEGGQE